MKARIVFGSRDAAAAGCKDDAGLPAKIRKHRGLRTAEARFCLRGKNLRNGAARAADDFLVRIEKRTVERGGKRLSDGAFAAAGHADKNDVFHLAGQKPFNAVNFRVRNRIPRKILASLFRLRHEHR